jgi:hypothetical protein
VASSADGKRLVAVAHGGGIYTWQATATPSLNIRAVNGEILLSWTIPSTHCVLQEASDLSTPNWTNVVSGPVLNPTNLENQVTVVPPPNGKGFYRLKLE